MLSSGDGNFWFKKNYRKFTYLDLESFTYDGQHLLEMVVAV